MAARRVARVVTVGNRTRNYHDNIVEHYENPRNVGSLDKKNVSVGTVRFCHSAFSRGKIMSTR